MDQMLLRPPVVRRKDAPWTAADIDLLKKLVAEGLSYSQIAARMGRGRNACLGKAHRMNIQAPTREAVVKPVRDAAITLSGPKRRANALDPALRAAVQKALAAGQHSRQQIAALHGTTPAIVAEIATAMGGLGRRARARVVDDAVLRERLKRRQFAATPPVTGAALDRFADGYMGQQGRIALEALERQHCRFPIDMADGTVRSCGLTREDSSPYCPAHAARCFNSAATVASSLKPRETITP